MKLELPFLGRTKARYIQEGINDFYTRLSHYVHVEIKEIKTKNVGTRNKNKILASESKLLEKCITPGSYRVALDCRGQMLSSEQLSEHLADLENRGMKNVIFIIGGPLGLAEEQLERADFVFSLSHLTFPHDMARLFLLEQLYRAYTIKAREQYHK